MSQFSANTTRTYKVQATGDRESLPQSMGEGKTNIVATRRKCANHASVVMVVLCLVVGVSLAVVVPMLLDSRPTATPKVAVLQSTPKESVSVCAGIEEAQETLGYTIQIPAFLSLNCELSQVNIVNDVVFEAIYIKDKVEYCFRMAQGAQDPSGVSAEYEYTNTQGIGNMTWRFMGTNEDQLQVAVWLLDDNIYSLRTSDAISFEKISAIIYSMPSLNPQYTSEPEVAHSTDEEVPE